MQSIILKYGTGIGTVISLVTLAPLLVGWEIEYGTGEVIGYTTMLLSSATIYFAIRTVREEGGKLSFGQGVKTGLLISLVGAGIFAFFTLLFYAFVEPDFAQNYFNHHLEQMAASGAPQSEIDQARTDWANNQELYSSPLFNAGLMFFTVLPIGALVTLVSSALLRRS